MTTLYLIRHGKVAAPQGICYGQSDISLKESPSVLAGKIRNKLPKAYALWSSPLSRCRLIAEELGRPNLDDRLMEMNFGDWEMQSYKAIGRSEIDAWAASPFHFCPPCGECVKDMQLRVVEVLAAILADTPDNDIVIVTHAGPIRIIIGQILKQNFDQWAYRKIPFGEVIPLNIAKAFCPGDPTVTSP